MREANTYKVNNSLHDVSDADLITELVERGYEVFKWEDDPAEWEDNEIINTEAE